MTHCEISDTHIGFIQNKQDNVFCIIPKGLEPSSISIVGNVPSRP